MKSIASFTHSRQARCIHHSTCAFGTRPLICMLLSKTLFQDCPPGEIRHSLMHFLFLDQEKYCNFSSFSGFLSMWISNTATTAMMIPIIDAIAQASSIEPDSDQETGTN